MAKDKKNYDGELTPDDIVAIMLDKAPCDPDKVN
jgi:hypothetical protein